MSFWSVFFGFTLGLLFLGIGIMTLWAGHWVGAFLVVIALLLLPPVRFWTHKKTGLQLSALARTCWISLVLALFVLSMRFFVDDVQEQMSRSAVADPVAETSQPEARP